MNEATHETLSAGAVLLDRQQTLDFYANMAEQPLDVIYLGETVCSKRRAMMLDDWLGLARDLAEASSAQLVLSGLTLVEAASELSACAACATTASCWWRPTTWAQCS